eukprot:622152-Pyramimonas_sp.AAC.1
MGVKVADTLAEHHKKTIAQSKKIAQFTAFMASRSVRMFKDVGGPLTKTIKFDYGPKLSLTEHEFVQDGALVKCTKCLRIATTPVSYRTLFHSQCFGAPKIGRGHELIRWGPAGI